MPLTAHQLIIDIGNTRTKLGIFYQQKLVMYKTVAESVTYDIIADFIGDATIEAVMVSASGFLDAVMLTALQEHYEVWVFDHTMPVPIGNEYATPATLGKDRLAAAVGAYTLYRCACLIIDTGTCTTYNVVSSGGVYLGGAITPGMDMRLRSMHEFTARLPLVAKEGTTPRVGDSTDTALRTGAVAGAAFEMQGFIADYLQLYPDLKIILTGGNTDLFAKRLNYQIFVEPNIVLIGLFKILQYNVENHH